MQFQWMFALRTFCKSDFLKIKLNWHYLLLFLGPCWCKPRYFSDHNKTLRRSHFLRHHWLNQTSSSCFLCIKVKRNTSTTVITGHFRMVCDHLFILLGDMSSTKIILGCILLVQCRISLTCQWYVKLYWSNAVCLTIHYWISLVLCV